MALTGKNNHQSVLDDDASLFQIKEEKSERQKWSEMNAGQRIQYFTDYYLLKCIICIIVIAVTGIILWTVLKPQKERELFLAVVHNTMIPEKKESLEQLLTELFVSDPKHQEVRVDDSFPSGYESDAKLSAFLAAEEIDLIITNETHFQSLAQNDCFADLDEIMPEFTKLHQNFVYQTEGYREESESNLSEYDTGQIQKSQTKQKKAESAESETKRAETSKTPAEELSSGKTKNLIKSYGINVTNCSFLKESWFQEENAILGIVLNGKNQENASSALKQLLLE